MPKAKSRPRTTRLEDLPEVERDEAILEPWSHHEETPLDPAWSRIMERNRLERDADAFNNLMDILDS